VTLLSLARATIPCCFFSQHTSTDQIRFRWVQCQLDILSRLRTPGAIQKALISLPPTLDISYQDILGRIDGEEDRQLTQQILQILAFNLRPLMLPAVCKMLQVTPGLRTFDESKRLTHPKDVLDICGTLLDYDKESEIVTLAHHSVKTYLMSDLRGDAAYFQLNEEEGHRRMATYSLTFLCSDTFSSDAMASFFAASPGYRDKDFLDYAVQQWAFHTKEVKDLGEPLWSILQSFLLSSTYGRQNFQTWVQFLIPGCGFAKNTPPLYYAASYGLTTVVQYLIDIQVDVEVRGGRGGATPINIAAFRGHLDVVKLLLQAGADPYKRDVATNMNAVQGAGSRHHWHVVKYLEKKGYEYHHVQGMESAFLVADDDVAYSRFPNHWRPR